MKISNKKILLILLLTNGGITTAHAEFSLGAGVIALNSPYKEYDMKASPFPAINYKGEHFWINGLGAGYYLYNDSENKLSLIGYYDPTQFKHEDSDSREMRRLLTRKGTMMAGLSYVHKTNYGSLRTVLAGDMLGNSDGMVVDMAWLYRYDNGSFSITPAIGFKWNSKNQSDYYYGVSRYESKRSGITAYKPDANINPYAELSVGYEFLTNWNVYGVGRWTRLSDEITDSPIVEDSWDSILSMGVTYTF
ncbi:MipA/OmpV family protein [Salmonella enterica subsp. enterica serovar Saintpaul]|nr:MipA/OmpV family protein [Salmonella enterica subsp. enterica serovar Saintpaul]